MKDGPIVIVRTTLDTETLVAEGRVAGGGVCVTCKVIHLLLAKRMERITNNKQAIDKSDGPSLPEICPKVNSMTRQALHYLGNFKVAFALPR